MLGSSKCKDNLIFFANYGAAEKNQAKVYELLRKIMKKFRLSALASQSLKIRLSSVLQGKQKFKC